jgi:glycosyltransferase involved in cell wall biosynthesis
VVVGSDHIRARTAELVGGGPWLERTHAVPPGVDVEAFAPERGSRSELAALLRARGGRGERGPDREAAGRLAGVGRFVLYFGKLLRNKGVHVLLDAWREAAPRHPDVTLVVVGFGGDRAELEAAAGERVVFTGAMDHEELQRLVPLADAVVVPSVLPEAFGMVAAEAASCGVVPIVANHSGLAEVAEGLGEGGRTFDGTASSLVARLAELLAMDAERRRRLGAAARAAVVRLWSWDEIARRLLELAPAPATTGARD